MRVLGLLTIVLMTAAAADAGQGATQKPRHPASTANEDEKEMRPRHSIREERELRLALPTQHRKVDLDAVDAP